MKFLLILVVAALIGGGLYAGGVFGSDGDGRAGKPDGTPQGHSAEADTAPGPGVTGAVDVDTGTNQVVVMKTSMGDIEIELFPAAAPRTVKTFIGLAEGTRESKDRDGHAQTKPFFDDMPFHRVIAGFMIQGGCPLGNGMGDPGFKFEDEINATGLGLDHQMLFPTPNSANPQPHPYIMGIIDQSDPRLGQQQFQQMIIFPLLKALGIPPTEAGARTKEWQSKLMKLTLKDVYENQGYVFDESLRAYHPKRGVIAMANSGPNTNGSQFFINVEDTPHLTGKHTVFGRVIKGMDVVDKISKVKVDPRSSKPIEDVKIISIRRKTP